MEKIWQEPIWREPDLSRIALQVYVPQAAYPVVRSYVCRDHWSVQHEFPHASGPRRGRRMARGDNMSKTKDLLSRP